MSSLALDNDRTGDIADAGKTYAGSLTELASFLSLFGEQVGKSCLTSLLIIC